MSKHGMDRRDFLHRLGLSGLALGMGGASLLAQYEGSGTKSMGMRSGPKVGLCTIAFQELPFPEAVKLAAEVGFDGVEPWGKPDHIPLTLTDDEVRKARSSGREQRGWK